MSIIHLIVGDVAAGALEEAVKQEEALNGEVIVLKDILHVGFLKDEHIASFSDVRSEFWNNVIPEGQPMAEVNDLERLMEISTRLSNQEDLAIWYWMAPSPADVTAYFWLLHYLKKHIGRVSVINISGLPFLDEQGKLFYPDSFGNIPVKEIIKAKKLSRVITPSEWETDGDEWKRLVAENAGIRVLEGGKKLSGKEIGFYDDILFGLINSQPQKATKIVNQAMTRNKIPTGDWFLLWRLRTFADHGRIEMNKGEVRLITANSAFSETEAPASGQEE